MADQRVAEQPGIPGFSFVRPLGSGGFAQVYLYEQDLPRRVVAVKVLDSAPDRRDVFEREADAMAGLSAHPSIVSIYQAGIALSGRPYLVMEYCPASLGALTKGSPAPLNEVLDAGVRLAGALETAHRAGMLHRDIKPSNVLVTQLGRPALSDFGIARSLADSALPSEEVAMSVPWSAPEVVRLDSAGSVASEIWSLAATLYTFAAGRSPFEDENKDRNTRAKLIERIGKAEVRPIPGATGYAPFDAVLARAMQRTPGARFASMAEFGAALQDVQRGFGYDVTPLEIIADAWQPRADLLADPQLSAAQPVRGPVVSAIPGRQTRAQARDARRAEQSATDADGVVADRAISPARAALIGAGITLGVVLGIGALVWAVIGGAG
ncbi:serine/threonine-protein kinase [Leucobacter luti]|uniref:serine/threonine-protein kinase n=1 Tax=Leucobacter luti TaxID=340320 RepID=UPI00104ED5FC|nr:serine/threonine-protein kinase [Leucobacter luti]MCW2289800.1 serine/threonine protein kinase [Leucobacter luti]QYM77043.1 serine/threonine protein kinase [Leucobacter luti]TCK34336.1 serine/threonine protein kinase [Leucobacter luti]